MRKERFARETRGLYRGLRGPEALLLFGSTLHVCRLQGHFRFLPWGSSYLPDGREREREKMPFKLVPLTCRGKPITPSSIFYFFFLDYLITACREDGRVFCFDADLYPSPSPNGVLRPGRLPSGRALPLRGKGFICLFVRLSVFKCAQGNPWVFSRVSTFEN